MLTSSSILANLVLTIIQNQRWKNTVQVTSGKCFERLWTFEPELWRTVTVWANAEEKLWKTLQEAKIKLRRVSDQNQDVKASSKKNQFHCPSFPSPSDPLKGFAKSRPIQAPIVILRYTIPHKKPLEEAVKIRFQNVRFAEWVRVLPNFQNHFVNKQEISW